MVQTGSADTLDGSVHFDKDQSVLVSVTPNDGTEDGIPVFQMQSEMHLFLPLLLFPSPSAPNAGQDDLVCSATSTDADGDSLAYTYLGRWTGSSSFKHEYSNRFINSSR